MKNKQKKPPRLALLLLQIALPRSIRDDIIGDLHEEFCNASAQTVSNYFWFWGQTISTCVRYIMKSKNVMAGLLSVCSMAVFTLFMFAILYLSNADDSAVFANNYWTDGNFHQFFADPAFWRYISTSSLSGASLSLFINIPSLLWAIGGLTLLFSIKTKTNINLQKLSMLAVVLLCGPYLWGVVYFNVNAVPLRESGPILAIMLLSVLYTILPISYVLVRKLRAQVVWV